ncbi:hypothetical protein G9274_000538 [Stenotrophomonas rhizophila]|nr:hypothetical protein G9274_000538 [Stenotrophomonas rhizophila]
MIAHGRTRKLQRRNSAVDGEGGVFRLMDGLDAGQTEDDSALRCG